MLNLTNLPVPILSQKQLNTFTKESILSKQVTQLNLTRIQSKLQEIPNQEVCAIDIGETAIKADILEIKSDSNFKIIRSFGQETRKEGGNNYLKFLLNVKKGINNLPVGISVKGKVSDTEELIYIPDLSNFFIDLNKIGGFKKIFNQHVKILNDGVCLTIAGFYAINKNYPQIKQLITVINGGGIGGAIIDKEKRLFATEPGHIQIVEQALNPYHVQTPCGFGAGQNVCLERVGAVGVGIETQWEILKGQKLTGEKIGKLIPTDETALKLFDTSTLITAYIIEGLRKTHDSPIENTAIICHGGAFKAPGFKKRIKQILEKHYQKKIILLKTSDLGFDNACMAGATIAAILCITPN